MLAFMVAWAPLVRSQVSVEIEMDQKFFLPHESLVVKVLVTNFSGQALVLGDKANWLTFHVEGQNNRIVASMEPVPVTGDYTLDSSKVGVKPVDLAPYFDLSMPDHYSVTAIVNIPQWNLEMKSKPAEFDIVSGTKLWSQDFGVPLLPDAAASVPEVRQYMLLQTIHQRQLMLYFQVSNPSESNVIRVFPVGPMVSFSKPEPQIDQYSNIHLLYQTGARRFTYSMINPDGLLISRETYDYSNTRPRLQAAENGRISVSGGQRRITSDDLPPPTKLEIFNEDPRVPIADNTAPPK